MARIQTRTDQITLQHNSLDIVTYKPVQIRAGRLIQPSVLGHLPFTDKAATRRSSFGGCRFPFLAKGLHPFQYPTGTRFASRYDLRDLFKGWQRSTISPPLSIRPTFESSPLTSPSASKPTTTMPYNNTRWHYKDFHHFVN